MKVQALSCVDIGVVGRVGVTECVVERVRVYGNLCAWVLCFVCACVHALCLCECEKLNTCQNSTECILNHKTISPKSDCTDLVFTCRMFLLFFFKKNRHVMLWNSSRARFPQQLYMIVFFEKNNKNIRQVNTRSVQFDYGESVL